MWEKKLPYCLRRRGGEDSLKIRTEEKNFSLPQGKKTGLTQEKVLWRENSLRKEMLKKVKEEGP